MSLSVELNTLMNSLSCVTYNGAQHAHILIEERDSAATLNKVTLQAATGDWFSFNPDDGRKCKRLDKKSNLVLMSPLLVVGGEHSHHCACDAVILVRHNGKLTILYIDLKSDNPTGYAKQFQSTRRFVRYVLGLLEEFYGYTLPNPEERYVIFCGGKEQSLNKKTTVPKRRNIEKSKPDQAYKHHIANNATIYLKELLA